MTTATAVLLALCVAQPSAQAAIAPAQEALLLLRSLAYDRNLATRQTGSTVVVSLLSLTKEAGATCADLHQSLDALVAKHVTLSGRPVEVNELPLHDLTGLAAKLKGSAAVVVCCAADAKAISEATRANHVLSYSTEEDAVHNGLSVGFIQRNGKPVIMVNLAASKEEGVAFESAFLQVAEVVR